MAAESGKNILEEIPMSMWNSVSKMANGLVLGLAALGLTGTAALADEVVLYSSNQPELLDVIAQGFKEKTGLTTPPCAWAPAKP